MLRKHRLPSAGLLILLAVTIAALPSAAVAKKPKKIVVPAGVVKVIPKTTTADVLIVGQGGAVVAPQGKSLTLTVNKVETGGVLQDAASIETTIAAGTYRGKIVLTIADENLVEYVPAGPPGTPSVFYPFRQAVHVDAAGVAMAKSVKAAWQAGTVGADESRNLKLTSTGEDFNGVYVAGGTYSLVKPKIKFTGNGRSDFAGAGAAIMATGENTTLVVDGASVNNQGVVRTAVVADKGANVVVKNSTLSVKNGTLPDGYVPTVDTAMMRSVPWMLSLSGNARATNLLGTNTKASYVNSSISAEGWGVLSTAGCTPPILTAINSTIAITGEDGYGSYGIGDAAELFLGCTFNVATYATISRGSELYYGDSTKAYVAQLNTANDIGLSEQELAALPEKATVVDSERFGIMWHGGGTLEVTGGTQFNTKETTFLDKGQALAITVDGSKGAKLTPENGVLFQLMDDDDPGPQMPGMVNTGVWHQPTGAVTPQTGHDLTKAGESDALVTFSAIDLQGDLYNGMRGDIAGMFGPASPRNLGVTLKASTLAGVISASTTKNKYADTIDAEHYRYLGEVDNTVGAAVNNGVIVSLDKDSTWTVTGASYLTSLTLTEGARLEAPLGKTPVMTVNGTATPIAAGTYTGAIVITVQ